MCGSCTLVLLRSRSNTTAQVRLAAPTTLPAGSLRVQRLGFVWAMVCTWRLLRCGFGVSACALAACTPDGSGAWRNSHASPLWHTPLAQ